MDAHITFFITVSILAMLVGFVLLFLVSWRKATDRHEFRLFRMLGLLAGCLLVPMPLIVGAWLTRSDGSYLFAILAVAAVIVGTYSPHFVLFIIKCFRGDAKQFLK